jgi:hypothetical protein
VTSQFSLAAAAAYSFKMPISGIATTMRPGPQDVFSANPSFVIKEGNDRPVEFRVTNERAAFDGKMVLGQVTRTPRGGRAMQLMTKPKIVSSRTVLQRGGFMSSGYLKNGWQL